MFSGIDTIVLFASAVLLGASLSIAWLALRRTAKRQREEDQSVTAAAAAAQLQEWRNGGLLVMSDKDFGLALELEKYNPGQLRHVALTTRRIIDEEELEPGNSVRLTVRVEYKDQPEGVTKSAAKPVPPQGHLELTAEFA